METSLEITVKIQKFSQIDRPSRKCSYLRISGAWSHRTVHTNLQLPLLGQLLNCIHAVASYKITYVKYLGLNNGHHTPVLLCTSSLCAGHAAQRWSFTRARQIPGFSMLKLKRQFSQKTGICTHLPLLSRLLPTSFIITGNPYFSSLFLPLWKSPISRMVMNECLVTASLKSTPSPCWLTWNATFCSGHLQRNILDSFTEQGIASFAICQVHGLFYFNKI